MTTDPPVPHADPADVAEQLRDAFPPAGADDIDLQRDDVPIEANEADVAEQRIETPNAFDEDSDGT